MKKKVIVYLVGCCIVLGTLFGCGQEALTEKSRVNKSKTTADTSDSLQVIKDRRYFEIENGVLLKFFGGFVNEAEIILPTEVKKIGKEAFSLTKEEKHKPVGQLATLHLSISKQVELEPYAFQNMGPMIVSFEKGRTNIEERAFFGSVHTGISSEVVLPDSVVTLEKDCFRNNLGGSHLHIKLGSGIQKIADGALYGVSVDVIPASVRYIGKEAFGEWGYLPNDLPEGVQTLGSHFLDLTYGRINIPSSVKEIAPDAVWWQEDSEKCGYDVAEDNPYFASDSNGWLYSKDGKTLYYANLSDTNYTLPKKVKRIYKKGLVYGADDSLKTKIKGIDRVRILQ